MNPDADYDDINYLLSSEYLNSNLLKNYPGEYLGLLESSIRNNINLKSQIHSKEYHNWYSNHLICLYYLVGDLRYVPPQLEHNFYGKNTSINENLGIEILNALFSLDIDIYDSNYYEENIMDIIKNDENENYVLTSRINNKNFIEKLKKLIRSKICPGSP